MTFVVLDDDQMNYSDNGFMMEMQAAEEMMHRPGEYSMNRLKDSSLAIN